MTGKKMEGVGVGKTGEERRSEGRRNNTCR